MKLAVLALLSVFVLVSCEGSHRNTPDKTKGPEAICQNGSFVLTGRNGIIGGQPVDGATWLSQQTVFLISKSGMCTGTLIDTNIVLTAAHCVDDIPKTAPTGMGVMFSVQPECDSQSGALSSKVVLVNKIIVHPEWKSQAPNANRGDLAMLLLATNAPTPWKPAHLATKFVDPRSQPNLVAGYGNSVGYNEESVVLLRATWLDGLHASTQNRAENYFREGMRESGASESSIAKVSEMFAMGADKEMIYFDQSEGRGVCSGDSGGSSYTLINGRYDITGVASAVMNTDDRAKNKACGMFGIHTSVTFHQKWIEETFQSLRNSDSSKKSAFE